MFHNRKKLIKVKKNVATAKKLFVLAAKIITLDSSSFIEKRNQNIRDDILIDSGHLPSYGRQIKHEEEMKAQREEAQNSNSDA